MVYLVGAGPGNGGLITLKGLECIKNADVIIYDHLVNPTLLNYAKSDCLLMYAGKIAGEHHMEQDKINAALAKYGKTQNTVRLKGGDPFVFGRGGEEAECLAENGIPYEIVPGVSSCYSAAEYCGIPVTHRGTATSFHVITGHEKDGSETVDYGALARLDGTLVFMMGLSRAENISQRLIEHGKSETTPAAVISNGTTEKQRCAVCTLKTLPETAEKMTSPAVILVGEAVKERREWHKPSGVKILATGTKFMNEQIRRAAKDLPITELSLIKTVPINFDMLAKTDLSRFTHIAFTSANGVDIFFDYLSSQKTDIRTLSNARFAAVGEKTALALGKKGIFTDMIPETHSGKCLAQMLCDKCKKSDNILLIRAENGADTIPQILTERGLTFTDLKLYRTETDFSKKELLNLCAAEMDYIVFSSGSAVKAYSEMLEHIVNAKFISIGSETTAAAEKYGVEIYKTAKTPSAEGIIECIRSDIK